MASSWAKALLILTMKLTDHRSAMAREDGLRIVYVEKRGLTPDNTCVLTGVGANKGLTCDPSFAQGGSCCSKNGWCGKPVHSSSAH